MKIRFLTLLLAICLLPCAASGEESAYLSGSDLKSIQPQYEAFLDALADLLIEKGLLTEETREAWMLYQLGDFLQNGGYGSIIAMYTPGLLELADESVSMCRLRLDTTAGTLTLDTLRRYSPTYSSLPGIPLDTELDDADTGEPVSCRFRWTATGGMLLIWDGDGVVAVGSTFVSDGRPLYWYEEPMEGCEETLRLEILDTAENTVMATIYLDVRSEDGCWIPGELK